MRISDWSSDVCSSDLILGTHCPNVLYPYVRQTIGNLIQAGGFPPFLMQPINFEALYAESLRPRAEQQAKGADGDGSLTGTEPAGNASSPPWRERPRRSPCRAPGPGAPPPPACTPGTAPGPARGGATARAPRPTHRAHH